MKIYKSKIKELIKEVLDEKPDNWPKCNGKKTLLYDKVHDSWFCDHCGWSTEKAWKILDKK